MNIKCIMIVSVHLYKDDKMGEKEYLFRMRNRLFVMGFLHLNPITFILCANELLSASFSSNSIILFSTVLRSFYTVDCMLPISIG